MSNKHRERLVQLAETRGVITTRQVNAAGIHRQTLTRLVREGVLERMERGVYSHAAGDHITENHGLVIATAKARKSVVCLISALSFHEIGTQLPHQIWLALEGGASGSRVEWPPVVYTRFSGSAFQEGIEIHRIEGQQVRIYSVAKTLADCFKYRNKVGIDVCLEALQEIWRERLATMDEIYRFARICRVHRVMQPYLEMVALGQHV